MSDISQEPLLSDFWLDQLLRGTGERLEGGEGRSPVISLLLFLLRQVLLTLAESPAQF